MKPGDTIEWIHQSDQRPVATDERMLSSTMDKWVTIGGKALLIGLADNTMTWLSDKGQLFHACIDDVERSLDDYNNGHMVVPRVCE